MSKNFASRWSRFHRIPATRGIFDFSWPRSVLSSMQSLFVMMTRWRVRHEDLSLRIQWRVKSKSFQDLSYISIRVKTNSIDFKNLLKNQCDHLSQAQTIINQPACPLLKKSFKKSSLLRAIFHYSQFLPLERNKKNIVSVPFPILDVKNRIKRYRNVKGCDVP